ncbi:MAG: NAD-binding protein [Dehalococcoidia bacterium]|nr:NAD-binding protein [Dehalococcoidia bacterium]
MLRDLRATLSSLPPNTIRAGIVLLVLPMVGTAGYLIIEGWGFLDAVYMTVIVLTTIGLREVRPLDDSGRIFTIVLAIAGVGGIFYALISVFQFVLEGELGQLLGVQRMKGRIERLKDHYILCGFGRVGEEIAREFRDRDIQFVVVENNPEAIERARRRGHLVLIGDATSDAVLRESGVDSATCLLAASDSDAGNTFIVLTAKSLNPSLFLVSRAAHPESEARMVRAGADRVFSPYVIAGKQMALTALQPMVVEFIDTLAAQREGAPVLAEIDVAEASGLVARTIHEVLHDCRSVVVLGVQKPSGDLLVGAGSDTRLEAGDRVIVMGQEDELAAIHPAFSRGRVRRPR